MIGTQLTRSDVDTRLSQITQQINSGFSLVMQMQEWLAAQTDDVLEAAPFGYTSDEVAVIKSAFSNLDQLRTVYEGVAASPEPQDFRTFAQQLWGFGF